MNNEMTWEQFEEILARADWNYNYASGDRYYIGHASVERAGCAYNHMKKIDAVKAEEIWKKYKK